MRNIRGMGAEGESLVQHQEAGLAPGKQTLVQQTYGGMALPERRASPGVVSETASRGIAGGDGTPPQRGSLQGLFGRPDVTSPADVTASSTSGGTPLPQQVQRKFEGSLGAELGGVRVHTGAESAASATTVSARAYTVGQNIHFGAGQYDPGSPAGEHLLAHEVAHTVQQSKGGGGPQYQLAVSRSGDSSEVEADVAADAMVAGRAASVSSAPHAVSRAPLDTNGGTFETTAYTPTNSGTGVGKKVGAHINLKFTPNDLVEANTIGLIQTVKTMRSTTAGGPIDDPSYVPPSSSGLVGNEDVSLGPKEGDHGRAIDQIDSAKPGTSTLPQTNPFYAVGNKDAAGATPAQVSGTLTDVAPDPANGWGQHGSHKRKPDGTFDVPVPAVLDDSPGRRIAFAGQEWEHSFEVTALVADGPMANTYLGSVAWGWKADATGTASLSPNPITLVRAGAPTSEFMAAAEKWNNTQFKDPGTGKTYDSVDVPITTFDSGGVAASKRTITDLHARLDQVNAELAGMPAGVDRTNKEFEKRALEAEIARRGAAAGTPPPVAPASRTTADLVATLKQIETDLKTLAPGQARTDKETEKRDAEAELGRRNVVIEVHVVSTEDWTGADEVYIKLTGASGSHKTDVRSLNDGQRSSFRVPLAPFVPLTAPLKVEVFDEDWPDSDDLIVAMDWSTPYQEIHNAASLDGANYQIRVRFE